MNSKFVSPAAILALSLSAVSTDVLACNTEPMLGTMCVFVGNFAPRGYALAQGQLLPISQNTALFSILGTTFGGNGQTTFALPDTRGRALVGAGQGPGLSNMVLGQMSGAESVTLTLSQMPAHTHMAATTVEVLDMDSSGSTAILKALAGTSNSNTPAGLVLANSPGRDNIYSDGAPNVEMNAEAIDLSIDIAMTFNSTTNIGPAGANQPFSVRDPYLAVNWIIALEGVYPSRN